MSAHHHVGESESGVFLLEHFGPFPSADVKSTMQKIAGCGSWWGGTQPSAAAFRARPVVRLLSSVSKWVSHLCAANQMLLSAPAGDRHLHDPGRSHQENSQWGIRLLPVQPCPSIIE